MAFVKKTWKDRIAEFPTRRRLTKEDNTSELVTVAREEGTLSQEGDAFSAENMNDLENRIDAEFTEVNGKLNKDFYYATESPQYVSMSGTKLLTTVKIPKPGKFLIIWNAQAITDYSDDFLTFSMSVSKNNAFDNNRGAFVTILCKKGNPNPSAFGAKYFKCTEEATNLYVYGKAKSSVSVYPKIMVVELP